MLWPRTLNEANPLTPDEFERLLYSIFGFGTVYRRRIIREGDHPTNAPDPIQSGAFSIHAASFRSRARGQSNA